MGKFESGEDLKDHSSKKVKGEAWLFKLVDVANLIYADVVEVPLNDQGHSSPRSYQGTVLRTAGKEGEHSWEDMSKSLEEESEEDDKTEDKEAVLTVLEGTGES